MRKLTTYEFIKRAKEVHGDVYDYSFVNYLDCKSKVKIICFEHGVFEQQPTRHLIGNGCPICKGGVKINKDEFIKRAEKIHGNKYDYSHVEYVNSQIKVKILCPEHGVFEMKPNNHLQKQGCKKCGYILNTLTTEQFIKKAIEIHGDKYDYSFVEYKRNDEKIKIICPKHGIFKQRPYAHLSNRGCPECKIKSKGELFIVSWLNDHKIEYVVQKSFPDCKNEFSLRYDFWLPEINLLIEYDGEPHFKSVEYLNGDEGLKYRKHCDKIKTEYAEKMNIDLLRIPYTQINEIPQILEEKIMVEIN